MEIEVLSPTQIDLWRFVARQPDRLSRQRVIRNSPLERPRELTSKCRVVFIMPCHLGVWVDKFLAMKAKLLRKMKA